MNTRDHVLDAVAVLGMKGYAPTIEEIKEYAGVSSTSVVAYWLTKLRSDGRVTWEDRKPRTLRIT